MYVISSAVFITQIQLNENKTKQSKQVIYLKCIYFVISIQIY